MSFADFLGGAAEAGAGIIGNQIRTNQATEASKSLAAYNEELFAKRQEVIEALRIKREAADQEKLMQQSDKVDAVAEEGRSKKNLTGLINTQAGIAGSAPAASEAELQAMLADPKNRKIYEDAGYIPKAGISDLARDKVDAARAIGADPRLRKEYKGDYDSALKAERDAVIAALAQRKADQADLREANRYETTTMQAQASLNASLAAMTRAAKSGDAQAESDAKTSATQAMNAARAAMKEMTDLATGSVRIENGVPTGPADQVEQYKDLQKLLRSATSKLNTKLGDKPDAWKPPASVDKSAALSEAKAAIAKGADPEKVKARLKTMGIDTKGL